MLFFLSPHQNDFVVETSLVGTVFNCLSHLNAVKERGQFIVGLLRGMGGNLNLKTRQEFAKEVRTSFCSRFVSIEVEFKNSFMFGFKLYSCLNYNCCKL